MLILPTTLAPTYFYILFSQSVCWLGDPLRVFFSPFDQFFRLEMLCLEKIVKRREILGLETEAEAVAERSDAGKFVFVLCV